MKITRRDLLAGLAASLMSAQTRPAGDRPNFIFILTDDQRWDSFAAAGHPFAKTPNMDRLAREGARFSNAFVTTSLCSPSRATFLTGQYAHLHGVRNNVSDLSDSASWTYPKVLQQAGYDTAFFGKWHMGADRDSPRPGFNRWMGFKGQGEYVNPEVNIDGKRTRLQGYMSDLLTDHAVSWLRERRDKPFCCCLWHKAVHVPIIPAARHANLYADARHPLPASYNDEDVNKPEWVKARKRDKTGVEGGFSSYGSMDEFVRRYYRTLAAVDESIGRVLEALEQTGELDRTVVIFAGDNGFLLGEHGLINKRAMYEESIRIPMIVRYPKLARPGAIIPQMALNNDIAPTILDIAGAEPPKGMLMQGASWKPLLEGKPTNWRASWFYEYFFEPSFAATPSMQGVRTEKWKYVRYPDIRDREELYDLQNDPAEMKNLAGEKRASAQLERMRTELYRLVKETIGG